MHLSGFCCPTGSLSPSTHDTVNGKPRKIVHNLHVDAIDKLELELVFEHGSHITRGNWQRGGLV